MNHKLKIDESLLEWTVLKSVIMSLDENQAARLLELEKAGRARLKMMQRIHSRFSRLRAQREQQELGKVAKA